MKSIVVPSAISVAGELWFFNRSRIGTNGGVASVVVVDGGGAFTAWSFGDEADAEVEVADI